MRSEAVAYIVGAFFGGLFGFVAGMMFSNRSWRTILFWKDERIKIMQQRIDLLGSKR